MWRYGSNPQDTTMSIRYIVSHDLPPLSAQKAGSLSVIMFNTSSKTLQGPVIGLCMRRILSGYVNLILMEYRVIVLNAYDRFVKFVLKVYRADSLIE